MVHRDGRGALVHSTPTEAGPSWGLPPSRWPSQSGGKVELGQGAAPTAPGDSVGHDRGTWAGGTWDCSFWRDRGWQGGQGKEGPRLWIPGAQALQLAPHLLMEEQAQDGAGRNRHCSGLRPMGWRSQLSHPSRWPCLTLPGSSPSQQGDVICTLSLLHMQPHLIFTTILEKGAIRRPIF